MNKPATPMPADYQPEWLAWYSVHESKTGRTWRVTLRSSVDPRSSMPGLHRTYWIHKSQCPTEYNAACLALNRAFNAFHTYYEGTKLVHDWRNSGVSKQKRRNINKSLKRDFGDNWTYTNPKAQDKARALLRELEGEQS